MGNKIYFGSYPQTEVTADDLKATLNEKAGELPTGENAQGWTSYGYYNKGEESSFMWYVDVEADGEKYRGVYFTSYRSYHFDESSSVENSYQDNNGYDMSKVYWFKYDPIVWTIINEVENEDVAPVKINDNFMSVEKNMLVLCDMIIDSQAYQADCTYSENGEYYNATAGVPAETYANNYAQSMIRKWLNDTFYNTAFNDLQKQIILTEFVKNTPDTTIFPTNIFHYENTEDKVFLLSYADMLNSEYKINSALSAKKTTDYARAQGAYTYMSDIEEDINNGNGWWLLRSPYSKTNYVSVVDNEGKIDYTNAAFSHEGVVPVMRIVINTVEKNTIVEKDTNK